MQCCVTSCYNNSENISQSDRITFHKFPSEEYLHAAWLDALGQQESHLQHPAVVCSQHFLSEDFYKTESGSRQVVPGAIPSAVQITRRHIELIDRTKHRLKSDMVSTTLPPDHWNLHIVEHPSQDRLAELEPAGDRVIVKIEKTEDSMSDEDMETINGDQHENKVQNPVKCERANFQCTICLEEFEDEQYIPHMNMHQQADRKQTHSRRRHPFTNMIVKIEKTEDSMSDEDMETINEDQHENKVQNPVKCERAPFQCTICLDEFEAEQYIPHMSMHQQQRDDVSGCATSQACERRPVTSLAAGHKQRAQTPSGTLSPPSACDARSSGAHPTMILAKNAGVTFPSTIKANTNDVSQKEPHDNQELNSCQYPSNFTTHLKTHIGEKPLACTFCEYRCVTNTALVHHTRKHTGEKPYSCDICEFKSSYKGNLVGHMRTHTGEKPFACMYCQYKSVSKGALVHHLRTHTCEKPYSCELCDYKCVSNTALLKHMRTHTGEKRFSCEFCDYKCVSNSVLMNHARTHTGEKPFQCKVCHNRFAHKSHLVRHMKTHTGEKPFMCNFCDYKTAHKDNLMNHIRTHTGDKPYACELCEYKSAAKNKLVIHMRTHTGEKPYSCELCDYKCVSNNALLKHLRTHTGEKRFSCEFCDYKCVSNSVLMNHAKTHWRKTVPKQALSS